MKKIIVVFLLFTGLFLELSYAEGELNLEESLGKKYKLEREKDNLSCFIPLAIKGIDTIYLKNNKDQVVYTVEIWGSEGNCNWEKDRIMFQKNLSFPESNYILRNYKQKIYFNGYFQLMFRVKKLLPTENLDIRSIKVPYFVLINNNKTNEVLFQEDLSINISLPKEGEQVYKGERVSLKESFLAEDFVNLETLSGIYFKKN